MLRLLQGLCLLLCLLPACRPPRRPRRASPPRPPLLSTDFDTPSISFPGRSTIGYPSSARAPLGYEPSSKQDSESPSYGKLKGLLGRLTHCFSPNSQTPSCCPPLSVSSRTSVRLPIMFFLYNMERRVTLHPSYFGRNMHDLVTSKLLKDVEGTCAGSYYIISIMDTFDISEGRILPSNGLAEFTVGYRAVVWRPFKGETVRRTLRPLRQAVV